MVSTSGFGPGLGEVFGPSHGGEGPELVQLLTPEGERVEHPDFGRALSALSVRVVEFQARFSF